MSDNLKKHISTLDKLTYRTDKKVREVPKFIVGSIANMLKELNVDTNVDKNYRAFMEKMREAYAINAEVPKGLNATLRDYQLEGFRWLCRLDAWGAGACLADDMGLGKTLQTLTFLLYKAKEGPSLVVMPKSVMQNWETESLRFTPELKVINLNNETSRAKDINNAGAYDLILCTYGVLGSESERLSKKEWNVVCLDEAHQIKNHQSMTSRAAKNLTAKSRIILTGTPLQNHLGDLWSLFQFINPGMLRSWNVFRDSFMIPSLDYDHKMLLRDLTQPFILRRTKEQVLTELPDKLVDEYYVTMSDEEKDMYEKVRMTVEAVFKKHKTKKEKETAKGLNLNYFTELMRLRQAACSMRLIYPTWKEQSSKIIALMDILSTLTSNPDNNILVFSQFTSFLDMVKPELDKHGMEYLYLDGQTPLDKRKKLVEKFQRGQTPIFLASLKAGGLGLNLTAANYVILLDPWWNPAIENQAMDRAHRIGQERVVSVVRLITQNTIEEKILRLHETKQKLSDDVLYGTADSYKLTYEDIMDMVAPM